MSVLSAWFLNTKLQREERNANVLAICKTLLHVGHSTTHRFPFAPEEEVLGGAISLFFSSFSIFCREELLKVPSSCADVTWALWSHMCGFSRIFRDFPEVLDSWVRFHSWEHHWICQGSFHTWMLSTLLFKAAYGDFLPGTLFICFFCLSFCLWSLSIFRITPAPQWCFYFIFPFSYFFQSILKNCKEIPFELFLELPVVFGVFWMRPFEFSLWFCN